MRGIKFSGFSWKHVVRQGDNMLISRVLKTLFVYSHLARSLFSVNFLFIIIGPQERNFYGREISEKGSVAY
jgi:hypothetical protein